MKIKFLRYCTFWFMIDGWFIVIIFNPLMHKSFSELANWLWACYFFQCENIEILIVCPRKCICILFCQTWFSSNVLSHTSQVIGSDASKCSRVMLKIRRKVLAELHELEVSKTRGGPNRWLAGGVNWVSGRLCQNLCFKWMAKLMPAGLIINFKAYTSTHSVRPYAFY